MTFMYLYHCVDYPYESFYEVYLHVCLMLYIVHPSSTYFGDMSHPYADPLLASSSRKGSCQGTRQRCP